MPLMDPFPFAFSLLLFPEEQSPSVQEWLAKYTWGHGITAVPYRSESGDDIVELQFPSGLSVVPVRQEMVAPILKSHFGYTPSSAELFPHEIGRLFVVNMPGLKVYCKQALDARQTMIVLDFA